MILFGFTLAATFTVVDIVVHCFDAAGGVSGARAREFERARIRRLTADHGARAVARRHG